MFSNQKFKFGYIVEGLRIENVGIFDAYMEHIMAIWYILWSLYNFVMFGIFFTVLVYCVKKNLATLKVTKIRPIWSPCCGLPKRWILN
jgi:hypothetical protein